MSRPTRLPVTDAQIRRVAIWIANTVAEEGHAIGHCVRAVLMLHPSYKQLVVLIDDIRAITGWEMANMVAAPASVNSKDISGTSAHPKSNRYRLAPQQEVL